MSRFLMSTYGPHVQLSRGAAPEALKNVSVPAFDGFPPDAVYDVTDELVNLANELIQLARARDADGKSRYTVAQILAAWQGEEIEHTCQACGATRTIQKLTANRP